MVELNQTLWNDFISILSEFGYTLSNKDNNTEKHIFIWEIIINIKVNMKEEIEHAIRMNLNLCFAIEEDEQVKEVNFELFKINHLLDQNIYRFDNDPEKGLKDFHKIIISTYGNIDNFIENYKLVKENLSFFRKRKDYEIINKYIYLKKITLPLRGYEDLRMALLTILKKFTELKSLISNPKIFNVFNKEIDIFIEKYQTLYKKEHSHYHDKLRQFYKKLYNLSEYNALECLSNINIINVAYNLKPIKKYIDTFFPEECLYVNIDEILDKQVKCSCGFTIGETLTIPSLNKIKPMLRKGIFEYIEKIKNPRFKPLFDNYLSYNQNSAIRKFLEFKTDIVNANMKYINKELVLEINTALSSKYPLKISLKEIISQLTDTYPVDQLDLLAQDIENNIRKIIKDKLKGMKKIDYDDIIINLVV